MKRFVAILLAVHILGLAIPKQSEANGAWVVPAIIGSIIFGALINESSHAYPAYAPSPPYVYGPPVQGYVNPPPVIQYYHGYGQGYRESRLGYRHYRGYSVPPQYGWERSGSPRYAWGHSHR